jgi:Protein of unknown function (DUF4238)
LTNKRTKIHHFVPKALQRYFCFEDERIWYSERGLDGKFCDPQLRNIDSVFKRKNYYTILEANKPSDRVEREFYGPQDDALGIVLKDIHDIFKLGKTPVVKGETLDMIRQLVFRMMRRSPEFMKSYDELAIGQEVVEEALSKATELNHSPQEVTELRQTLSNRIRLQQIGRHVRVTGQISSSGKVEKALEDFSIRWAVSSGSHSFILSSQAVYRIGNRGSNGLNNPIVEIWLPISPKIALVLLRDQEESISFLNYFSKEKLRKINEYAVESSTQIASHSKTLLLSLLSRN